jgi:uncharacterized protein RhaS with RHS repeats
MGCEKLQIHDYFTSRTPRSDLSTLGTPSSSSALTFTFDALNRLVRISVSRAPGVPGTTLKTFAYDAVGNPVAAFDDNDPSDPDDDALVERTYDKLNRLVSETLNGRTVER